jgi:hypothetical protein
MPFDPSTAAIEIYWLVPVSLRIAFDLDGVLADMDTELRRRAEGLFGEAIIPPTAGAP